MKKILTLIITILVGCSPQKTARNPKATMIQMDNLGIHWISSDKIIPTGLTHAIVNTIEINVRFTMKDHVIDGTSFDFDFYGDSITILAIEDPLSHVLGFASLDNNKKTVIINKLYLKESYRMTSLLLAECSLQKEIVPLEDFCEAVLLQEIWHLFNAALYPQKQEYFSEFPSLESRAKNFYLASKFINNNFALANHENLDSYLYLQQSYKYVFETDKPETDRYLLAAKFKELVQKHGFDGLIKRYKNCQKQTSVIAGFYYAHAFGSHL